MAETKPTERISYAAVGFPSGPEKLISLFFKSQQRPLRDFVSQVLFRKSARPDPFFNLLNLQIKKFLITLK